MRKDLLKVLRLLEGEDSLKNEYVEYNQSFNCNYSVVEHLNFPNYRLIVNQLNKNSQIFSDSAVRAELKRMEHDHLVFIGSQTATTFASTNSSKGPDFDEPNEHKTESVVLTTRGKNPWHYFLEKAAENPITLLFSLAALTVSIIALFT